MSDRRPVSSRPNPIAALLALSLAVCAFAAPRAFAAWTATPLTLGGDTGAQTAPVLVPQAGGGFLAAWIDRRDTSGVWINTVSALGAKLLPNGQPIAPPDSLPRDLSGLPASPNGALLVWSDVRTGTRFVYAQRSDANGNGMWTRNGVRLATGAGAQTAPVAASDGAGGAFVAWIDDRNGNPDVYAQHVLADGSMAWAAAGVAVCTADSAQETPAIAADGLGGCVIAWGDRRNSSGTIVLTYMQRLGVTGAVRWTANGIALDVATAAARPVISCAGSGKTFVFYEDAVGGTQGFFAQRYDSTGANEWSTGGGYAALTNAVDTNHPIAIFGRSNGTALAVWGGPIELRTRVLSAAGVNGALTTLVNTGSAALESIRAQSDGAEGCWISYTNAEAVTVQRVLVGGGAALTPTAGVVVSPATTRARGAVSLAPLTGGEVVAAWEDADTGGTPDTNVVAQRMAPTGAVGEYYVVTATAGTGGSLTPGPGTYYVQAHDSLRFVATADPGFHVLTMLADAVGYAAVPNLTFHDVTTDHTLAVSFDDAQLTRRVITTADAYQLLSFPFTFSNDSPDSVFHDLWPMDETRWRFGRWDPVAKAYGTPSTSVTHVEPGKGYWLATHAADTLDFFSTQPMQTSMAIALTPAAAESTGWNMIGVPYRFPLAVSSLLVRSGGGAFVPVTSSQTCTDSLVIGWDAVNGYQPVATMQPGRGYWLFKRTAANVQLRYTYEYSQGAFAGTPAPNRAGEWAVALTLSQAGAPDAHVTLGAGARARTVARFPASPGRDLALWTSADGGDASMAFAPAADAMAWDVFARGEGALAGAELRVAFDGVPEGREVVLADPVAGWSRVVRDGDRVALAVGGDARRLVVSVRAAGAPVASGVTALRAVAPNPFSDRAALSFVLGMAGDLRAYVYDVTGRRVADLSRRGLAAGEHVIAWDGRDGAGDRVAPGVYLVRWSAGGRSGSARIVSLQ